MKYKIIAFPFAGGSKFSYKKLETYLSSEFEWITLELPGRGMRFNENLLDDMTTAIDSIFQQVKPFIETGYYMFYGHSLGTLLGYEIVKKIKNENLPLPACLYVTGRGGPAIMEKEKIADLPFKEFWKTVDKIGGVDKGVFNDKDVLELFTPILRADFRLVESYEYKNLKLPISIPIYVCMGEEEMVANGGKTTYEQVMNWDDQTTYKVTPEFLSGDHFFIYKHPRKIVNRIVKAFENHLEFNPT